MNRVALVTGANQGLGYALVGRLLTELDADDRVYSTTRNVERGNEAVQQLACSQSRLPGGVRSPRGRELPFAAGG